jgi:glycosyltransferase involved in cell wall biosynthesis
MTAYNRQKYIGEAISSVLASSHENFELIITDDCSEDNTVAIARAFVNADSRVKLFINEKNIGDYPNRNRAAGYASGKYLKYLDSDDTISPGGLKTMVQNMEKFPSAGFGLVGKNMGVDRNFPILLTGEEAYKTYFFKCALLTMPPTGSIIKRDVFEKVGGFSGQPYIGDTEMWLRLSQQYDVVCMAPGLVHWRVHEQQQVKEGMDNSFYEKETLKMHARFLQEDNCPLKKKDAAIAWRNQLNIQARTALRFLLALKINKTISIVKNNGLSFSDLLYALKKNIVVE